MTYYSIFLEPGGLGFSRHCASIKAFNALCLFGLFSFNLLQFSCQNHCFDDRNMQFTHRNGTKVFGPNLAFPGMKTFIFVFDNGIILFHDRGNCSRLCYCNDWIACCFYEGQMNNND